MFNKCSANGEKCKTIEIHVKTVLNTKRVTVRKLHDIEYWQLQKMKRLWFYRHIRRLLFHSRQINYIFKFMIISNFARSIFLWNLNFFQVHQPSFKNKPITSIEKTFEIIFLNTLFYTALSSIKNKI